MIIVHHPYVLFDVTFLTVLLVAYQTSVNLAIQVYCIDVPCKITFIAKFTIANVTGVWFDEFMHSSAVMLQHTLGIETFVAFLAIVRFFLQMYDLIMNLVITVFTEFFATLVTHKFSFVFVDRKSVV